MFIPIGSPRAYRAYFQPPEIEIFLSGKHWAQQDLERSFFRIPAQITIVVADIEPFEEAV